VSTVPGEGQTSDISNACGQVSGNRTKMLAPLVPIDRCGNYPTPVLPSRQFPARWSPGSQRQLRARAEGFTRRRSPVRL